MSLMETETSHKCSAASLQTSDIRLLDIFVTKTCIFRHFPTIAVN